MRFNRAANLGFHSIASYGRGAVVERGRGVGVDRGVSVAVAVGVTVTVAVAVGVAVASDYGGGSWSCVAVAVGVGVGVGPPDCAQYLPPVLRTLPTDLPPQTIISVPVQTAVCCNRATGTLVVLVAVQLSVPGLYLPPVFNKRRCVHLRPRRSFHCPSTLPCAISRSGRVGGAGGCPTIRAGIVSPAGVRTR